MTTEQKNFIEMIGNAAVSYYKIYGILPSLTIAQAILESAWGKSGLSRDCYNYFGMKWKANCGCEYKEYSTKEQKADGTYYTITAKFRKYPNASEGIKGYYVFLSGYKRYANLKGVTDAATACDLIRQDGWATSLAYATNLKRLIQTYNLTAYDEKVTGIASSVVENVAVYQKGNYRVKASALKVRKGPGTKYAQKKFTEMTVSAQSINESRRSTGLAFYLKDIIFTAQEIITVSTKEYWARTPSGYVCLELNGEKYVTKA